MVGFSLVIETFFAQMIVADDDQEPLQEQQQQPQHHAEDEHSKLDVDISIFEAFGDATATGKRAQVYLKDNTPTICCFQDLKTCVFFFRPCVRRWSWKTTQSNFVFLVVCSFVSVGVFFSDK